MTAAPEPGSVEWRLDRIEKKLDEKIVFKDVYDAEKKALEREVAGALAAVAMADSRADAAKTLANEKAEKIDGRIDAMVLRFTAALGIAYLGLIAMVVGYILQQATR